MDIFSQVTNEDCMALMARYPDKYFELAVVDPPYGIGINVNMGRRKGNKKSNYHKFAGQDQSKSKKEEVKQRVKERNIYIEQEGSLFHESETHEWFIDEISTRYARKNSISPRGEDNNDGIDVVCFIVRDKSTGDYERVIVDRETNEPIYSTLCLEQMAFQIDKLKLFKRLKNEEDKPRTSTRRTIRTRKKP